MAVKKNKLDIFNQHMERRSRLFSIPNLITDYDLKNNATSSRKVRK